VKKSLYKNLELAERAVRVTVSRLCDVTLFDPRSVTRWRSLQPQPRSGQAKPSPTTTFSQQKFEILKPRPLEFLRQKNGSRPLEADCEFLRFANLLIECFSHILIITEPLWLAWLPSPFSLVSFPQPEDKKKATVKKKAETGSWPCKISGCSKVFAREADLKRHQRTTKLHSMPGL
jgi:hypothetical protein